MSEPETACAAPREASEATTALSAVAVSPPPSPPAGGNLGNLGFLEQLIVLSFYAYFFCKWIPPFLKNPTWPVALVIASEGVAVVFLLVRRPAHSFSASPGAWFLAMATTVAPALLAPVQQPFNPAWVGVILAAAGYGGRIICTVYLGRSFGIVAANRGVKRNGPYRLVRHPIYASYLIIHAGLFWLCPSFWNVGVLLVCWSLMIWRILVEESHLRQDPAYVAYQQVVRYRLIPGVF